MKKHIFSYLIGVLFFSIFSVSGFSQELKVMSYNIRAFEGMTNEPEKMFIVENFADEIKKHNPDVICIQELETRNSRQDSRELMIELARLLGMYPIFGYSYTKEAPYGLYGNAILSKHPILNSQSRQLPYDKRKSHDQRSYITADILIPTEKNPEGKIVRIVNTHLDHRYNYHNGQRTEHAKFILEHAIEQNIPSIIMGDMNEGPSRDAVAVFNGVCDRICNNNRTFMSGVKIDYIFGYPKNTWEKISYMVDIDNERSDHYPLIATIKTR